MKVLDFLASITNHKVACTSENGSYAGLIKIDFPSVPSNFSSSWQAPSDLSHYCWRLLFTETRGVTAHHIQHHERGTECSQLSRKGNTEALEGAGNPVTGSNTPFEGDSCQFSLAKTGGWMWRDTGTIWILSNALKHQPLSVITDGKYTPLLSCVQRVDMAQCFNRHHSKIIKKT